jgi:hypothetical protein
MFHCLDRPHFFYPFIHQWTWGCFHFEMTNNSLAAKRLSTSVCVDIFLFLLGTHLSLELLGPMETVSNLQGSARCVPQWLHCILFPPMESEVSNVSASSPALVIVSLLTLIFQVRVKSDARVWSSCFTARLLKRDVTLFQAKEECLFLSNATLIGS